MRFSLRRLFAGDREPLGRLAAAAVYGDGGRSTRTGRDFRREIVDLLEGGELMRSEVAEELQIAGATARKWLLILQEEEVVEATAANPRSRHVGYRLAQPPARHATNHAT